MRGDNINITPQILTSSTSAIVSPKLFLKKRPMQNCAEAVFEEVALLKNKGSGP